MADVHDTLSSSVLFAKKTGQALGQVVSHNNLKTILHDADEVYDEKYELKHVHLSTADLMKMSQEELKIE